MAICRRTTTGLKIRCVRVQLEDHLAVCRIATGWPARSGHDEPDPVEAQWARAARIPQRHPREATNPAPASRIAELLPDRWQTNSSALIKGPPSRPDHRAAARLPCKAARRLHAASSPTMGRAQAAERKSGARGRRSSKLHGQRILELADTDAVFGGRVPVAGTETSLLFGAPIWKRNLISSHRAYAA